MAGEYYKLVSSGNPNTDWTQEVVLESDEDGNPTKVASTTVPSKLNAEDRKNLEARGLKVESVSKEEAEEVQESQTAAGGDVAGSGPVFGTLGRSDQDSKDDK